MRNCFKQDDLLFISDVVTVYSFMYYIPDTELSHPPQVWDIQDEENYGSLFKKG